jgi:hypothetical protein
MEKTMTRYTALALIGLVSATTVACEKPGAMERQREDQAKEQLSQAKGESAQRMQAAQAAAEKDIVAARADFEKTREDYRRARAADLSDLDKKIAELEAKEKTANPKMKVQLRADLVRIRAKREAFLDDMYALNNTTAATWDGETARTGRDWDALKSAVDKTR